MVYASLFDVFFRFGGKKRDEQYIYSRNRQRFIGDIHILVYFCIKIYITKRKKNL